MSCLGVHFALTDDEVTALKQIRDEQARLTHIQEVIEEDYFENQEDFLAQSDKAWDAMHRALADGELTWDGGDYPFNHVVLAGELLYSDSDYIMSLKHPSQVKDIARELSGMTEADFRQRYFEIKASYEGELNEEDFSYTWEWFQAVRDLYARAAAEGRWVLFTADQ